MGIAKYLKEIGRGSAGARPLSREQAADLMGQLLDGQLSDLEIGAFCLAMRIKGETPEEMAGFLDATQARLHPLPYAGPVPAVVLPSYNGSRRLPLLTPLLAALLAREGLSVVIHGARTEALRVTSEQVMTECGIRPLEHPRPLRAGEVVYVPTQVLTPALQQLLEVRRVVGLRNPAHSLVKLMNPIDGPALLVGCYTHPEYASSMADTFTLRKTLAVLLRGTEGEPVADPRRAPMIEGFYLGQRTLLQPAQEGPLASLPSFPTDTDPVSTARYTQDILQGHQPIPIPVQQQVACLKAFALKATAGST